eukprot:4351530-Alexandrium_andersonii.AAC.1
MEGVGSLGWGALAAIVRRRGWVPAARVGPIVVCLGSFTALASAGASAAPRPSAGRPSPERRG